MFYRIILFRMNVIINSTKKTKILKNIKNVFKNGYVPSRGAEKYTRQTCDNVNCLEHACFNFSNQQILDCEMNTYTAFQMFGKFCMDGNNESNAEEMLNFITDAGIVINQGYQPHLKDGQWRVALYFNDEDGDFHFLLQEKDGSWSGKVGFTIRTQQFDDLPETIGRISKYYLYNTYTFSNPNYDRSLDSESCKSKSKKIIIPDKSL